MIVDPYEDIERNGVIFRVWSDKIQPIDPILGFPICIPKELHDEVISPLSSLIPACIRHGSEKFQRRLVASLQKLQRRG